MQALVSQQPSLSTSVASLSCSRSAAFTGVAPRQALLRQARASQPLASLFAHRSPTDGVPCSNA